MFQGAVDYRLQFARVLHFAAFGESDARLVGAQPRGIAIVFMRPTCLANLHQKGLDHVLLHTSGLPEDSLGVKVDVEVPGLDDADGACFFAGFAFGCLAVRETSVGGSLGKRPLVAAVGVYQQKLGVRVLPAVADGCDLQRESELGRARGRPTSLVGSLLQRYFRNVK